MQRVQEGNGQCVAVLFIIPVIIDVCGHIFEEFTLVSEIHDNVDLELGMKNVFELEGVIDISEQINTIFPKRTGSIKTKRK